MLVSLTEVLELAEARRCAVGAFNTTNLECIRAVLGTAERLGLPVIISHAQIREGVAPLDVIGPVMVLSAKRASVPVCVHLDHCTSLDYMERALALGFTGVMYDGSLLPYEENVENTRRAVRMTRPLGAGVEAEIGRLARQEDGSHTGSGPVYTEPELAVRFAADTGIDALAPSFGTSHGIYRSKPVLDLERVAVIRDLVKLPLVMHGGSGVSPEDYRAAIQNGIRKINYFSYMSNAGVKAVKELLSRQDVTYFHDLALAAQGAMAEDVEAAMRVFCGL